MSAKEIVAAAKEQIAELQKVDDGIAKQIDSILEVATNQLPLSKERRKEVRDLQDHQIQVLTAMKTLALVTLEALDKSEEITALIQALIGVKKDLSKVAIKIEAIQTSAKKINEVGENIGKLLTQLQAAAKKA